MSSQQIQDCEHDSGKKIRREEAGSNGHSARIFSSRRRAPQSENRKRALKKSVKDMIANTVREPREHSNTAD